MRFNNVLVSPFRERAGDLNILEHPRRIVRGHQLGLLTQTSDPDRALAGFVDVVSSWKINGDTYLVLPMAHLVALLVRLGYHDGATRLHAVVSRGQELDALVAGLPEAMSIARETLGESGFAEAAYAGAALSDHEAGELAHQLITTARNDLATDT